ncbi:MAG: acyltransferase [Flavobacteriales bacterium]
MSSNKVYFPNLNGLRFFAALAVIFTHIELVKRMLGFGSHWRDLDTLSFQIPANSIYHREISWVTPLIANSGPLGVVFFFVLSGFLITYLLFSEKELISRISIKQFYMRRILRIWPLYYFVMFLGFFVLNKLALFEVPVQSRAMTNDYWENFFLFLFLLPNLSFSMYLAMPNIGQLWSIGVEEQFYIIWPWIIRKTKGFLKAMVIFTVVLIIFKVIVLFVTTNYSGYWFGVLKKFVAMSKLECMSLGGIGAYLLFYKKEKIVNIIESKLLFVLAILIIPILIFFSSRTFQNGIYLIYSVSFLVIILHLSAAKKPIIALEYKWLNYLGKISFGIYMYHMMSIALVLHIARDYFKIDRDLSGTQNLMVYLGVIGITIILASLSYYGFERYFIRLKKGVTNVTSGENAK